MPNVLFVDLETDVLDKTVAKAVQIGLNMVNYPDSLLEEEDLSSCPDYVFNTKVNSQTKMSYEAMSVHRIEQDELEGKPLFEEVNEIFDLVQYADYVVAHNGRCFDFVILERQMADSVHFQALIRNGKWFDTLSSSRRLYIDAESHKLGALMYEKNLVPRERRKELGLHEAGTDTMLCRKLFELMWIESGIKDLAEFMEYDKGVEPAETISMGKYHGVPITEIKAKDPGYLQWCLKQNWLITERPEIYLGIIKEVSHAELSNAYDAVYRSMRELVRT